MKLIFRKIYFIIVFLLYKIKYKKNVKFNGLTLILTKSGSLKFGKKIIINSSSYSNLLGISNRTHLITRGSGEIVIGNNVGISGSQIYSIEKITISDNCLIGTECKIVDNDFHPIEAEGRLKNKNVIGKEVFIGNNVFIGMRSIILKGTFIGENSVVGAGAVVKGVFPSNVIIAGNPAKIIKKVNK